MKKWEINAEKIVAWHGLCQASSARLLLRLSPKITQEDKFETAFRWRIYAVSLNCAALLHIGQNIISELDFLGQAGQTDNKQTSPDERVFWRRPEATQKPHARWSYSSFFALWEPTHTHTHKNHWRKGKIKFYDAPEDRKMTRQLRCRASKIHMKSCICLHAYLLISAALNSSLLSSAPNPCPVNDKSSLSCALWRKYKRLHTIPNATAFQCCSSGSRLPLKFS